MGKPRKVIPDWESNSTLVDLEFDEVASRYLQYKVLADDAEAEKKRLSVILEGMLTVADTPQVMFGSMVCSKRNGGQPSTISATKLLEQGVDADVIANATVPGAKYTYFEMRDPAKQKDNRKNKNSGSEEDSDE